MFALSAMFGTYKVNTDVLSFGKVHFSNGEWSESSFFLITSVKDKYLRPSAAIVVAIFSSGRIKTPKSGCEFVLCHTSVASRSSSCTTSWTLTLHLVIHCAGSAHSTENKAPKNYPQWTNTTFVWLLLPFKVRNNGTNVDKKTAWLGGSEVSVLLNHPPPIEMHKASSAGCLNFCWSTVFWLNLTFDSKCHEMRWICAVEHSGGSQQAAKYLTFI